MKKLLLAALLVFCALNTVSAQQKKEVIIIIDPSTIGTHDDENQHPRTPIRIPSVYIDGNILTFDASCIGCTISLVQDDEVIYTATVVETDDWEGEVVLPEYLTGVFELQLQIGAITFVGEIEL